MRRKTAPQWVDEQDPRCTQFEKYIPGFSNRLMVTPGLTGYAQVNGGYSLKPEEKIIYDMEYIERQTIILDIRCLLKTVHIVFSHEGAR